jgi:hypothetical protein
MKNELPGFRQEGPWCYRKHWRDDDDRDYIITVARVVDGWMYKWERGSTQTVGERGGARDLNEIMSWLWEDVFRLHQHYHALLKDQAERIVRGDS